MRAMVKLELLLLTDWTKTSKNQTHKVTPMLPSRPPANHESARPSIRPGRRQLPALLALWTLTASPLHRSVSLSLQKVLKSPLGLVQTCLCQVATTAAELNEIMYKPMKCEPQERGPLLL